MSYRLEDIKHETRNFFVLSAGERGYEVYEKGPTAAMRVASIGHGPAPKLGLVRAVAEADRRQGHADAAHDKQAAAARDGR